MKANASSSTYNSANSVSVTCLAICAKPVVTLSVDSTSGKPIISWKTVSGAAKYDVYRSTTETGTYTKLTSQSGLKYTDTTAAPDTAYWYKVVARGTKAACDSRDSVAKQIRSSLAKPVVTFTTDGTSGKPVLKWTAVDGATGYEVHRSSSATKSYKAVAKLGAGETSYQDASVSAGKGYYYKVVAIGKNTKSAFSSYKKLSAKCAQPVITAKADSTSGKPIISWSKVTGAKKYTVYSVSASGALTSLGTTTKTTFTHTKATVGTKYTYVVKANASKSTYNSANSASVTCTAICAQPVATVKLDAATGKPVVSWKAVSGAVSYEVYRSENGGQFAKISAGNVTSYTDTKAVADRQYTYKVKAIGKSTALNSEVGNVVSITATCAAPKITGSLNGTKPMISWASVEGATGYTVYRSTKSGSGYKAIAKGVTASSYTDNSAKKGKTYYYKVVAQSQNTTSAMSNYVKIKSK